MLRVFQLQAASFGCLFQRSKGAVYGSRHGLAIPATDVCPKGLEGLQILVSPRVALILRLGIETQCRAGIQEAR